MAKSNQLNVSIGVDSKAYKSGWDEIVKLTVQKGEQTEKEADKMVNALNKRFEKLTMKQQIRQMENLAAKMDQMGLSGTKAFGDVIKKSGELKAAQSDLKDLIEASRPDAPFKAMQNALQGAANAYAGLQGGMQLFGAESEDTQKALLKVQAAMAFAQGFESIDQLNDSFKQLNLTIKANPILAVAAAVAAITAAVISYNEVYAQTADITENVAKASLTAAQASKEEELKLNALWAAANDDKISKQARLNAIEQLNKEYPSFNENLTLEKINSKEAAAAHRDAANAILMKAKAAAVADMITDLYKKETKALYDLTNGNLDYMSVLFSGANINSYINLEGKKIDGYQKQRKALEDLYTSLVKVNLAESGSKSPAKTPVKTSSATKKIEAAPQKQIFASVVSNNAQGIKATNSALSEQVANTGMLAENYAKMVEQNKAFADSQNDVTISAQQLNAALNAAAADGISSMSAAIGTAIITGQDLGQAIGQSFLTSLAEFLQTMGKMMITTAATWAQFEALIIANPIAAVGVGVAAVAAGAMLKAQVAKGAQPTKFASGGMVNSPTFAMVGDNLNAHNNPEFIMRRDQLGKLVNNTGSFEPRLIPIVDAKGISILVENGNRMRNR